MRRSLAPLETLVWIAIVRSRAAGRMAGRSFQSKVHYTAGLGVADCPGCQK